jgi:selenocysteine-specific elongation factor
MPEALISMVLGTAGHIDHGKTTLLQSLTGINADRLKEEQERGITIDIGFAPWVEPPYAIGFVDVPGHERFIKNMLAGVGGIDGVLMVVAADEGVMPQTREHFEIVNLLGVHRGIIAITKCDKVEPDYVELVEEDVRQLVAGSFLEMAPVVRTSATHGAGLEDLKAAIRRLADGMGERDASGVPRLFIDRVFVARGFGAVVTGTTLGGVIRKNDWVSVLPAGLSAKVRFIQVYGQECEETRPGQRAALNLAGVEPGALSRGMVVAPAGVFTPSSIFNAQFHLLKSFGKTLKNLAPVHVYHGSAELLGRVQLLEHERLEPGDTTLVQIRLESPSLLWPGDHFVVRQYSPLLTMGGGRILENHVPRMRHKEVRQTLTRLRRLITADLRELVLEMLAAEAMNGLCVSELMDRTGLSQSFIVSVLEDAGERGSAHLVAAESSCWVSDQTRINLGDRILHLLERYFAANPFSPGMKKMELRGLLADLKDEVFVCLIRLLQSQSRIVLWGERITLPGRSPQLESAVNEQVATGLAVLEQAGLEGLSWSEFNRNLSDEGPVDASMKDYLIQGRKVIRIAEDYYLHPSVLNGAIEVLRRKIDRQAPLEVPLFKDLFGLTRKRAIPLLEYLDRQGVTRRVGTGRILC